MKVGVLGGGQLGRMLAHAGLPLGISCRFYDPESPTATACFSGGSHAPYENQKALADFISQQNVLTLEWENVPLEALNFVATQTDLYPSPSAVSVCQDRLSEKSLATSLGIGTASFAQIDTRYDLHNAVKHMGYPGILKTRRLGYDGKGQWRLNRIEDVLTLPDSIWQHGLIYESFVPFVAEVSMISVRQKNGTMAFYPLIYNVHKNGVLSYSIAFRESWILALQQKAEDYAQALLSKLDYVGVLVIEFFVTESKELLLNEMAPRVHNSGHLTIDSAHTSQFENHLRAILGLDLGSTEIPQPSLMINLLGTIPEKYRLERRPGVFLHDYGKEEKTGRKVGHLTIVGDSLTDVLDRAKWYDPSLTYKPPRFTLQTDSPPNKGQ